MNVDIKYRKFNLLALTTKDIQVASYDWFLGEYSEILWAKLAYEVINNPTKYKFINNNDEYNSITRIFFL